MPPDVREHLLDLDISDPIALARKADALFQIHQSSAVNNLSDDLHIPPSMPFDCPSRELAEKVTPPRCTPPLQAVPALPQPPTATEDP